MVATLAFMASRSALASAVASSSRSLNSPQLASEEPPRMMKATMLLMAAFLQPHGPHLTPNVLQMRVIVEIEIEIGTPERTRAWTLGAVGWASRLLSARIRMRPPYAPLPLPGTEGRPT